MHYVGIDLHKVHSQICVMDESGAIVSELRISTSEERFAEVMSELPPSRVLIESCGLSEWAARAIERLGVHEVVVGDPGYALMYAARKSRVKTDLRDARALAEACRVGTFRKSYRSSDADMRMRRRLTIRRSLVESRASLIVTAKACLRQLGLSVPTGSTEKFAERVARIEIPGHMRAAIAPILASLRVLNEQIAFCDDVLERMANANKAATLLATTPGVGPVTACMFASVIGDASRFESPHQVQSYLGLVPSEHSSGERKHRGRITKTGNPYLRSLLIQTAVRVLRFRPPEAYQLWSWAEKIAMRRGKNVARVALARRLAGVLFAMLRDESSFVPRRSAPVTVAA